MFLRQNIFSSFLCCIILLTVITLCSVAADFESTEDKIERAVDAVEEAVESALESLDEIIQNELEDNRELERILRTIAGREVKTRQLRVARRIEEAVDTSKNPHIVVDHSYGSLHISAWDKNRVEIKALILVSSSVGELRAQRLADEITIVVEGGKDEIYIKTQYPRRELERGGFDVELSITVPRESSMNVKNAFGNLVISGILGSVESAVQYGNALIENCGDNLELKSKYGSAAIVDVNGDVTVESSFGGVHIAGVTGTQQVSNRYGVIEVLTDSKGGDIELHNEFGKIGLYMPEVLDAEVYASSKFGGLTSDLPLDITRRGLTFYGEGYFGEQEDAQYQKINLENRFGEVHIYDTDWDFDLAQFWDEVNNIPNAEREVEYSEQSELEDTMRYEERYEEAFSEQLSAEGITDISIEHSHGNIEVRGWDEQELKLDGVKIVRAKTQELAEEYAHEMRVEMTRDGDEINIRTIRPEFDSKKVQQMTINYVLMAPRQVDMELKHAHGNSTISNIDGDLNVDNRHGELTIEQIGKDVSIKHSHGNAEIAQVGGDAEIKKTHGNLKLFQVQEDLVLNHQHGNVEINDIGGDAEIKKSHGCLNLISVGSDVQLEHQHGCVVLEIIGGDVDVNKQHGSLKIRDVQKDCTITSRHSNIDISGVASDAHIEGGHGSMKIDRIGGDLTVSSEHANVSAGDIAGEVTIRNSQGNINVTAADPITHDYNLNTQHANITIDIPEGSKLDIYAHTRHGNIKSIVPLEQTKLGNDVTATGELNGGGVRVELTNSIGNIKIQ